MAKTPDDRPEAETPDAEASTETAEAATDAATDVTGLSYEQARDELAAIVARLESGQVGLEGSMTLWERGEALARHCEGWLDAAEARLKG